MSAFSLFLCASAAADVRARSADPEWTCGESGRPWVVLDFSGPDWDAQQQRGIRADLAAGLRLRGILVCPPDSARDAEPLARVQLEAASMERVSVVIEVHDSLTNKHVLREVDLRSVPEDARGVALAAAAEELLRASWAELALEDAPSPTREPPTEVTDAVRMTGARTRNQRTLGVRVSGEHSGGGLTLLGPEAWFSIWLGDRIATELAVGYRRGLDASAQHGTVETQGFTLSLDLLFALAGVQGGPVQLLTRVGLQGWSLEFSGLASSGGVGSDRRGLGLQARAGLVLQLELSADLTFRLEAGPGVALRGLAALDTNEQITSTSGVLGHAGLGFGAVF